MFRNKIGNAFVYFKTAIEYLNFLNKGTCKGGKCCDLYSYEGHVTFVGDGAAYVAKNSDAADLLGYNVAGRSGASSVHYFNWMEVGGVNIFNNVNLHTDAFRNRFTADSTGNFGEIDYIGATPQNAKSWAKNFTQFINNKFAANNIDAFQYTKYEVTVDTSVPDEIRYIYKFYVRVPKGTTVDKIQYERYDSAEFSAATLWTYSPVDAQHIFPTTLIKQVNCN